MKNNSYTSSSTKEEVRKKEYIFLNLVRLPLYNKHSKVYNAANNEVWLYEIFKKYACHK